MTMERNVRDRNIKPLIPIYTHLIPDLELAPGEASSIRNNFIRKLVAVAQLELKVPFNSIVVRDIRPIDDLDYTYQTWTEATGATESAYETMSTGAGTATKERDRWIGIFGVRVSANPAVSLIKFNVGGGDRAIWSLASLRPEDDMVGYSPAGVVIPPSTQFTISRYVVQASTQVTVVLKGVVVEVRGRLISP